MQTEAKTHPPRLEKPLRITEQVWPEGTAPVVSIWCLTYNHREFIRDAIEGFLSQETTFPVEIFIHDDASTDGTANIVRDYVKRYPNLIHAELQKQNQWSLPHSRALISSLLRQKGTYIALCEGDDYWIDSLKLELQVEYMMSHPTVRLVCTEYLHRTAERIKPSGLTFNRVVSKDNWASPYSLKTATALFRMQDLLDCGIDLTSVPYLKDIFLWRVLLEKGEAHVLPRATAVYRLHEAGVWSLKSGFEKSFSNLKTAQSMCVYLGCYQRDIDSFYRASLNECLAQINQARASQVVFVFISAVRYDLTHVPRIIEAFVRRVVSMCSRLGRKKPSPVCE